MTDHAGYSDGRLCLSDQVGYGADRLFPNGLSTSLGIPPQWQAPALKDGASLTVLQLPDLAGVHAEGVIVPTPTEFYGVVAMGLGDDFFERLILVPHRIDAGLVLSLKEYDVEIYNSFRDADRTFQTYVNNVDAGILIPDLPTLPTTVYRQTGVQMTVQVTTDGPAAVDGTLDFAFDTRTVYLPLTGQRSVIFPFEPEAPMIERLEFLTDVLKHRDDTEQRVALRHVPRSIFQLRVGEYGRPRQFLTALEFSSQGRVFGLPMWHEPAILTQPAAISDYTVQVDSTNYASFEEDALALVFVTPTYYELLQVDSFTADTITFVTPFTKVFGLGTRILPVRQATMNQIIRGEKEPIAHQWADIRFTVLDADEDIADVSAFSSYNGKVLLDEPNMIDGSLRETMERRLTIVDNNVGNFQVTFEADVSRRTHVKQFRSDNRQRLWEVRQLLYALRGRAVSFYLPTFYDEFTVTQPIVSSSTLLTFENYGYTKYVQGRPPADVIRVLLTDGTTIVRRVVNVTEIDEDEEQVEVDAAWGVDALAEEVERTDVVEKVRMDDDNVEIRHHNAIGGAIVRMPVRAVLE
jgi:hypothetical protein